MKKGFPLILEGGKKDSQTAQETLETKNSAQIARVPGLIADTLTPIAMQVNGMRNMAWRMATTKLILLLDADFLPSPRFVTDLNNNTLSHV